MKLKLIFFQFLFWNWENSIILSVYDWCGDILQEGQSANQLLAPPAAQIWQVQRIYLRKLFHGIVHSVFLITTISMSFRKLLFKIKMKYILNNIDKPQAKFQSKGQSHPKKGKGTSASGRSLKSFETLSYTPYPPSLPTQPHPQVWRKVCSSRSHSVRPWVGCCVIFENS